MSKTYIVSVTDNDGSKTFEKVYSAGSLLGIVSMFETDDDYDQSGDQIDFKPIQD